MTQVKSIIGFLCRFIIVFGLLAVPWPGWPDAYARYLRSSATTVCGVFGFKGTVWFDRNAVGDHRGDTVINVASHRKPDSSPGRVSGARAFFDSQVMCYLPAAFFIALVLATGSGWRRRLKVLAWGLVWVHLFIAFLLGAAITGLMNVKTSDDMSWLQKCAWVLFKLFSTRPAAVFAIVALVWIAVAFQRDDWTKILGREETGADKYSHPPRNQSCPASAWVPKGLRTRNAR